MTLTEQWKKGELPLGMYYVKMPLGVEILSDYSLYRYKLTRDVDSIEVLAPVPSYEEWKQLHKFLEEFNALEVAKENQQLKELLKECKRVLSKAKGDTVWYPVEIDHTLTQIDEVLK